MTDLTNGHVIISVEEYTELVSDSNTCMFLVNGMLESSRLSYTGNDIVFESADIKTLLKASPYANRYRMKLQSLMDEAEKEK